MCQSASPAHLSRNAQNLDDRVRQVGSIRLRLVGGVEFRLLVSMRYPPYLTAWNLGGGTSGNSTETFHRKMMISQYFTIFTTAGYEA